ANLLGLFLETRRALGAGSDSIDVRHTNKIGLEKALKLRCDYSESVIAGMVFAHCMSPYLVFRSFWSITAPVVEYRMRPSATSDSCWNTSPNLASSAVR